MKPILISACLAGESCRYDGKKQQVHPLVKSWDSRGRLIKVCPETAGGLGIPRPPCEIIAGTGYDVLARKVPVRTREGKDCTRAFVAGAYHTLRIALHHRICLALLKEKSPSCGTDFIYDGTFTGRIIKGSGVTAALLNSYGIMVFSEFRLHRL